MGRGAQLLQLGMPLLALEHLGAQLHVRQRLVLPRRQGAQVFYRVANDHVRQLVADAIHHAEHAGPGVPAHHRDQAIELKEAR